MLGRYNNRVDEKARTNIGIVILCMGGGVKVCCDFGGRFVADYCDVPLVVTGKITYCIERADEYFEISSTAIELCVCCGGNCFVFESYKDFVAPGSLAEAHCSSISFGPR